MTIILLKCFATMFPLFTCKLKKKVQSNTYYDIGSESHPSNVFEKPEAYHIQCIPRQPKKVAQRESNNGSKSRESIPTSNYVIYKKSYAL